MFERRAPIPVKETVEEAAPPVSKRPVFQRRSPALSSVPMRRTVNGNYRKPRKQRTNIDVGETAVYEGPARAFTVKLKFTDQIFVHKSMAPHWFRALQLAMGALTVEAARDLPMPEIEIAES